VTIPSTLSRTGNLTGASTAIYDPAAGTDPVVSDAGRTPFPGNIIPAARINPVAAAILALVPAPNQSFNVAAPTNNYYAVLPFTKTEDSVDAKIDYSIADRDRLTGRFSFQRPVVFQAPLFGMAGGDGPSTAFMGTGTQKTYSTGIDYNRTISATLLTEARIGVAHYHNNAYPSDYGSNDSTNAGIPGVNLASDPFTSGMVAINVGGNGGALNTPSVTQTANQWGPIGITHQIGAGIPWFTTTNLAQPFGAGIFGSTGRNVLSGPGMFRIDMSMFKTFQVTERFKMELRGESVDLTNTPAFGQPNLTCCTSTNANFGAITSTLASGAGVNGIGNFGRTLQIAAKLTF
jgi:hypothetical protein